MNKSTKLFKPLSILKKIFPKFQKELILLFLIVLYLVVRLYQLPQVVNFSMDQGTTLLKIFELWQTKKLTLIGPESSLKTINGLSFFHGPWIYYYLLPFLLIGNWNPIYGSYAFIILNLLSLLILFKCINKFFNFRVSFICCLFFILDITSVRFSQFLWNPNFLLFTSSLLIYFWLEIIHKPKFLHFSLIGLVFGFSLGSHFQTIIILFIFLVFMLLKKISLKYYFCILSGILLGLTPLLLFELKHNFYNLQILKLIFTKGLYSPVQWPLPGYYFLSLLPFIFLLAAIVLNKLMVKNRYLAGIIITIFIFYSVMQITASPASGFTMPEGWNLAGYKKVSQLILKENKNNYNVASLLSGDTRDYPLRYLLTIANHPPKLIDQYQQLKYLFVISRGNNSIINNPVWEINTFCPCRISKIWPIQNNINLYLLEKSSFQSLQGCLHQSF